MQSENIPPCIHTHRMMAYLNDENNMLLNEINHLRSSHLMDDSTSKVLVELIHSNDSSRIEIAKTFIRTASLKRWGLAPIESSNRPPLAATTTINNSSKPLPLPLATSKKSLCIPIPSTGHSSSSNNNRNIVMDPTPQASSSIKSTISLSSTPGASSERTLPYSEDGGESVTSEYALDIMEKLTVVEDGDSITTITAAGLESLSGSGSYSEMKSGGSREALPVVSGGGHAEGATASNISTSATKSNGDGTTGTVDNNTAGGGSGKVKKAGPVTVNKLSYAVVSPGLFEVEKHFYPRVLNAQIHPTVRYFMSLSKARMVKRYCHNHPSVNEAVLLEVLSDPTRHLKWAGCDLMHTTNSKGDRGMAVIETNSCPSGQKSTPLFEEMEEEGGYRELLLNSFIPNVKKSSEKVPGGKLAVIYDKNPMEAGGYASTLAGIMGENVYLVPFEDNRFMGGKESRCRFIDGVLQICTEGGEWINIRAAFRYVTQAPWNRIPCNTKTYIFNPIIACLAGGRNKMIAAKAYDQLNVELQASGLQITTPLTIRDVKYHELSSWVAKLGGFAVIKIPYSNAGQGVYTITSPKELEAFFTEIEASPVKYDKYIVQSLISNYRWSSAIDGNRLYHVGTIPDKNNKIYVVDLRMMVSSGAEGFKVVGIYARRARSPLSDVLSEVDSSWEMLGTNLSVPLGDGLFGSESERLLLMDRRDFNVLGMGLDDLIEAFIQTCLSVTAIDRMCDFIAPGGEFNKALFSSVNNDEGLLNEICTNQTGDSYASY